MTWVIQGIHATCTYQARSGPNLPLSPRPSERACTSTRCPHTAHTVHTARARLRLPGAAKAQTRPPARGHHPGPAHAAPHTAGSALAAPRVSGPACPSRRLYSPRQSHTRHTERSIFPDSRWKASHLPEALSRLLPAYHLLSHRESVIARVTVLPARVQPSARFPGDPDVPPGLTFPPRPNFQDHRSVKAMSTSITVPS